MVRLTLDPTIQQELLAPGAQIELVDHAGQTFGFFLPTRVNRELWEWAKKEFSDEEIEEARREEGGCTTEELLEKLRQL